MIRFAVEDYFDVIEDMKPLLAAHYHEIAWYQDKIPFDPDWERYAAMAELGIIHIVTARDDERLIGYFVSLVSPGMHYKQTLYALNDVLWLHPDYRGGTTAYKMFQYAFVQLKALGVDCISIHMKTDAPFEKLCQKLGMQKQEYLYSIYIGD
jgi:hypothetical protein